MGQQTGKIFSAMMILLVIGIQGIIFAAFFGFSMMNSENYFWLFPVLLISFFYLFAGFSALRSNKLDRILKNKLYNLNLNVFWLVFWLVVFFIAAYLGVSSGKPFNLLAFLSIERPYSLIALPLLLISVLIFEGLLVIYFYKFPRLKQVDQAGVDKKLIATKLIIYTSMAIFLSRNLWPPAAGDLYRALREISLYVMETGIVVLVVQRLALPFSFIEVRSKFENLLKSSWLKFTILLMFLFGLVIVLIRITGLGITYDQKFWNAAGVPILFEVVVFLAIGIFLVLDVQKSFSSKLVLRNSQKTLFLALGIWLVAVLFWNAIELPHTYFAPKPLFPNTATYPFSDASYFDIGAQYIFLGRGVNNLVITDRPMLMLLFALFHLLGGQDYFGVIFVQICFLALIPVLIFLLGKTMHSYLFGSSLALFVIFKEAVALRTASTLSVTNAKVLMSELPTAFFLILFTHFLYKWFDNKDENLNALYAGGVLGLTIMVRANVFPILFAAGIFSIIFYARQKQWITWLRTNLIFVAAAILVLLPYSIQTYRTTGTLFFLQKIYSVIDRSYSFSENMHSISAAHSSGAKLKLPFPQSKNEQISEASTDLIFQVGNYYAHNVIMTFMAYPTIPGVAPVSTLEALPYWDPEQAWQTQLSWYQWGMIGLNLSVLAVGIAAAFRYWRWNGLTLLMIFLAYHIANAAARTAGGRYLVPADWSMHFYYVLGIFSISAFLAKGLIPGEAILGIGNEKAVISKNGRGKLVAAVFILGFLGSLPVLVNWLPDKLVDFTNQEAVEFVDGLDTLHLSEDQFLISDIHRFLSEGEGVTISGLSLYPRFYNAGESDAISAYVPDMPDNTERVYFILLGKNAQYHVNLLQEGQPYKGFPHAEQMMVIGCDYGLYFDSFYVINLKDQTLISVRTPEAELTCNNVQ